MANNIVYYLWGSEGYLIDKKIGELAADLAAASGEDPEIVPVDADEISAAELGQILEFSPLFSLARLVIIKNPWWLGKSTRKAKKTEERLQVLEDYFQHDNDGQVLIITALENNPTNPVTKFLNKMARVINIKSLTPKDLEKWCQGEMEQRKLQASPAVISRIASSGQDMYYLENMFDKLSLIERQGPLGMEELDDHLDSHQETSIFKLTDALLNRNLKLSLAVFHQLLEQGQPHLLLLAMITQQYVSLSKVLFYHKSGLSNVQIAEVTGLKDFVIKKMLDKASRFTSGDIRFIFEKLLAADIIFKSESKDPQIVMETLLVELCGK